jgi:hypothetical protein
MITELRILLPLVTFKGPGLARFTIDNPGSRPRSIVEHRADGMFTEEHIADVDGNGVILTEHSKSIRDIPGRVTR